MKSKELIRQLQELDPVGDIEVIGSAGDISFADRVQDYYDGYARTLLRNEKGHIIGLEIGSATHADKIVLFELDTDAVLLDDPEAIIINHTHRDYSKNIEDRREYVRKLEKRVDRKIRWRRKHPRLAKLEYQWNKLVRWPIKRFFKWLGSNA